MHLNKLFWGFCGSGTDHCAALRKFFKPASAVPRRMNCHLGHLQAFLPEVIFFPMRKAKALISITIAQTWFVLDCNGQFALNSNF